MRSAEQCRVDSARKLDLERELARVSGLLKWSKERGKRAEEKLDQLRVSALEARLLREELGAVREDCARLVQLIRYG